MSNSRIHHLSKLSINKYLQSDVFLFHSLIAGDINTCIQYKKDSITCTDIQNIHGTRMCSMQLKHLYTPATLYTRSANAYTGKNSIHAHMYIIHAHAGMHNCVVYRHGTDTK